jgi:hypothetical protein
MIGETPGKLADDAEPLFDLTEQEPSGVGSDRSAVEIGNDVAASVGLKQERLSVTVCHDETVVRACGELCDNSTLRKNYRLVYSAL